MRVPKMRRSSSLLFIATILAAAALAGLAATFAVEAVERRTKSDVRDALEGAGIDWAEVGADGLRVDLTGTAPDEATRFRALNVAGSVVDGERVIDRMDVASREPVAPPRFSIELLRQPDAVTMIGLVPVSTDREALFASLGRAAPEAAITDLLEVASYPAPPGWEGAVDYGLKALGRLERAKVSISGGRVEVAALAANEAARDRLTRDLRRLKPGDVSLALDLAAPRPVLTPFTLRMVKTGGAARFDACSAASEADADAILSAARDAGLDDVEGPDCALGLGVPSPEWAEAARAAITMLGTLETGTLTMSDLEMMLEAGPEADAERFAQNAARLEAALPAEFTLTAAVEETGAVEPEAGPIEFAATRGPDGRVALGGRLGDERSLSAVDSFAKALFGMENVSTNIEVQDGVPNGWSPRVLAALDALSILDRGAVTVEEDDIRVSGTSGVQNAKAEITRILSAPSDTTPRFDIEVSYDESLDSAREPPTPQECADQINGVLKARQITFAPGSADIDRESRASVEAIADILRTCDGVAMEVAGYTDSQGSEKMNRDLSTSRADALLVALSARRVVTSDLEAQGYGEADPIADNSTPEGREANRRIEFRLIGATTAGDAGDSDAESVDAPAEEADSNADEDASGDAGGEQGE